MHIRKMLWELDPVFLRVEESGYGSRCAVPSCTLARTHARVRGGVMQYWRVVSTGKIVAGPNKKLICLCHQVRRDDLVWLSYDELGDLLLAAIEIEIVRDPPVVEILTLSRSYRTPSRVRFPASSFGTGLAPADITKDRSDT